METRQRITRLDLSWRDKLRNLQHLHVPGPLRRIDIAHCGIRRTQVNAHDIATGLVFDKQIG